MGRQENKASVSVLLGRCVSVFQVEVNAIAVCFKMVTEEGRANLNVAICSDSQEFMTPKVTSWLV